MTLTLPQDTIAPSGPAPARGLAHDAWVIARRGLTHMKRQPEALADATIQPIMFVLLFAYVFGGAIAVPGGHAIANLFKSLLPIALMSLCGLAIGWRIRAGLADAVVGYLLLVAFAF